MSLYYVKGHTQIVWPGSPAIAAKSQETLAIYIGGDIDLTILSFDIEAFPGEPGRMIRM